MLYIYSRDESQVKRGRKPLKKNNANTPKVKSSAVSVSGSDAEESINGRVFGGRRASERISPQKLTGVVGGSHVPEKKNVSGPGVNKPKSLIAKAAVIESKKKIKAAANALQKKTQNGPSRGRGRKANNDGQADIKPGQPGSLKKKSKAAQGVVDTQTAEGIDKKPKVVKAKNPTHLQNGHSLALAKLNSKIATQAKNALLKQQAQQAAHITVTPFSTSQPVQPNSQVPVSLVTNSIVSSPVRPPAKPTTPKSPADPNVLPPWSNPNLVIRTRKAAVHSPVVVAHSQQPLQQQQLQQLQQQSVLQQSLNRPAIFSTTPTISISTVGSAANVTKLQGTPDRNIFQLFTPSTSNIATLGGVTFSPAIRQVGPIVPGTPVVNQLRSATLINSVSLVNSANLSGTRFITTGVAGPSSVVVSAPPKAGTVNVSGNVSNITLVPTVINASGGQTLIPASGATIVNTAGGTRAVLNTARLTSPITLQSIGSLPYTVNLIKTNTGLTLPVRPQQILQTSLAQVARQQGYVLITPRARAPSPVTPSATVQTVSNPISLVQAVPGQTVQPTRVHLLAQVPSGTTVIQQPQPQKNVNGVAGHTPTKTDGT